MDQRIIKLFILLTLTFFLLNLNFKNESKYQTKSKPEIVAISISAPQTFNLSRQSNENLYHLKQKEIYHRKNSSKEFKVLKKVNYKSTFLFSSDSISKLKNYLDEGTFGECEKYNKKAFFITFYYNFQFYGFREGQKHSETYRIFILLSDDISYRLLKKVLEEDRKTRTLK